MSTLHWGGGFAASENSRAFDCLLKRETHMAEVQ